MKYLDEAGLQYLLSKLKDIYARKGEAGGGSGSNWYTGTELRGQRDIPGLSNVEIRLERTVHNSRATPISTAEITLTAQRDLGDVSISGQYYGNGTYDNYSITVGGREALSAMAGRGDNDFHKIWTGSISSGQAIYLKHYVGSNTISARESETYFLLRYNGSPEDFTVSTGTTDEKSWTATPTVMPSPYAVGDYYLNTEELTLYRCTEASDTSSSWTYLCALGGGGDLSGYATKADLEGYIPTTERDNFAAKEELSDYIPISERGAFATKDDLSGYIPTSERGAFATKDDLTGYIPVSRESTFATKVELADYVTKDELADYVTKDELAQADSGKAINAAIVALDSDSFENDGLPHAPKIASVTLGDAPLVKNVDYAEAVIPASAAGTYAALAIGIGRYTGAAAAQWSVAKPSPKLQLSAQSLTLKGVMGASDSSVTISRNGSGSISAESLDPEYASASVEGSALRVTSVKPGGATIVVRVDETEEHAAAEARLTVDVQRADGSISVKPQSLKLNGAEGTTATATITRTGGGAVSVSSSPYVSARLDGDRLTLSSIQSGSASLTISLAETDDYTAASCELDVSVSVIVVPPPTKTLAENSWATIAQAAANGTARQYWNVGDIGPKVTFTIPVADAQGNPTDQTTEFTCDVRIIGLEQDDMDETDEKYNDPSYSYKIANITFETVQTTGESYRMDDGETSGGWPSGNVEKKNIIREQVLPSIGVDSELEPWLRTVKKKSGVYHHNPGVNPTDYYDLGETADRLFIVSVTEVLGSASDTQKGEGKQYTYYKNGGSKRKQNPSGDYTSWWTRSLVTTTPNQYKAYQPLGFAGNTIATSPCPISICFCI